MRTPLNLQGSVITGGAADFYTIGGPLVTLHAGREGVALTLREFPALTPAMTLVLDIHNHQPTNERLFARFIDGEGQSMQIDIALFPLLRARAIFKLKWLDGELHFPPLSPGTLKSHVIGSGMDVSKVAQLQIGLTGSTVENRMLDVEAIFLTDEDEVEVPVIQGKTVDVLGQWKQKTWPGKMPDVETLRQRLASEPTEAAFPVGLGRYGGFTDTQFGATGFFRVEKAQGRWHLVDPDGHAFFSTGVFGVYPGEPGWVRGVENQFEELPSTEGAYAPAFCQAGSLELYRRKFSGMFPDETLLYAPAIANLIHVYGEHWYDAWTRMTNARLRRWGVNTLSMFSDPQFVEASGLPFVIMLKGYPVTKQTIFREFPDVFSLEYEQLSEQFAQQLTAYAENPCLIGYFLNNEPTWAFVQGVNLAEKMLALAKPTHSREVFVTQMAQKYGTVEALNSAWNLTLTGFEGLHQPIEHASRLSAAAKADTEAFTREMVERYAALPAGFARRAAPKHLSLGMRFASAKNDDLLATSRHFDVFSFNCYQASSKEQMDRIAAKVDMPILIGEFHFGALDAGLPSPSLFRVASQQARGDAYMRYVQDVAMHPCGVGAHYFAYNDQPVWGRYDGENYQFGFVDICHNAYEPFVQRIAETNGTLKALMDGKLSPLGGETQRC